MGHPSGWNDDQIVGGNGVVLHSATDAVVWDSDTVRPPTHASVEAGHRAYLLALFTVNPETLQYPGPSGFAVDQARLFGWSLGWVGEQTED
jgi:hypothetical protein